MTGNPTLDRLILAVIGLVALFVIIAQVRSAQGVAMLLVELVLVPVRALHETMQFVTGWLGGLARKMFHHAIETPPGEWVGKAFVATCFYFLLVLLFFVPESVLVLMALQGMGLVSADLILPSEAGLLVAVSFLAHGLFWGANFLDTVKAAFYHGCSDRPYLRWSLCAVSLAAGGLSIYLGVLIGAYRGAAVVGASEELASYELKAVSVQGRDVPPPSALESSPMPAAESAPPLPEWMQGLEQEVPIRMGYMLMGLTTLALFVGKWAVVPLLMYAISIASAALMIVLWPIRLALGILHEMIDVTAQIVESFLELVHRTGAQVGRMPPAPPDLPGSPSPTEFYPDPVGQRVTSNGAHA